MVNFAFTLIALLLAHVPTEARRTVDIQSIELQHDHNVTEETASCQNYCVQCADGSTVFYDRSRNKWKAAATTAISGAGLLTGPVAGVAAIGGATAARGGVAAIGGATAVGGAVAHTAGADAKRGEETHTKWEGNLPTTGFDCERMDVTYYSNTNECEAVTLMEKSDMKLGRVKNNMLKPWDADGKPLPGFQRGDKTAYKKGCKILKASGLRGKWTQFQSIFHGRNSNKVDKGAQKCSEHSKLCGNKGVIGLVAVENTYDCRRSCMQIHTLDNVFTAQNHNPIEK